MNKINAALVSIKDFFQKYEKYIKYKKKLLLLSCSLLQTQSLYNLSFPLFLLSPLIKPVNCLVLGSEVVLVSEGSVSPLSFQ